jgi:DNA helicase-2/ATP-dependent DNA helicase PcrA
LVTEYASRFWEVFQRYEGLLAGLRIITFDQIIDRSIKTLGSGGPARRLVDGKVKFVLVDEYQDLNKSQEKVLELLRDAGAEITVVGDDDQAIYQWRGGDISVFLNFPEHFSGRRRDLTDNRRSVPAIVELSHGFALTIDQRVNKRIAPVRDGPSQSVELLVCSTAEHEALMVTDRISQLIEEGHGAGDIVVLFRSVRTSARPLIEQLRARGIGYAITGRVSILDRSEAALIARIFVWWNGGSWWVDNAVESVHDETIAAEIIQLTGCTEDEALLNTRRLSRLGEYFVSNGFRDLQDAFRKILTILGLPSGTDKSRQERGLGAVSDLLVSFEHGMRRGAPGEWFRRAEPEAAQEADEDSTIQQEMQESGSTLTALEKTTLEPAGALYLRWLVSYLEHFAAQAIEETSEGPGPVSNVVNIMTIHQAKGLEFPIVFVPCMIEGRFPSSQMGRPQKWYLPVEVFGLEEQARYQGLERDERRLFYVAMTRAREILVLSLFTQHKTRKATPSRFIKDILSYGGRALAQCGECRAEPRRRDMRIDPINIECSGLLTYSDCPKFYYLRYVCGFGSRIAPELGYGRALHHTVAELARMAQQGRRITHDDGQSVLARTFYVPFATRVQRDILYKSAASRVRRFVDKCSVRLRRTEQVEQAFELPVGSNRVRGRVDLVLRAERGSEDEVELLDIKASENETVLHKHQNQLRLYAKGMSHLGKRPVGLAILDLEGQGGFLEVLKDDAALEAFESNLASWTDGIQKREFDPRPGQSCKGCEFKDSVCRG